jgi:putative intracellular protease/amidase
VTARRVLFLASNYGLWAEELQAPWDALVIVGGPGAPLDLVGNPDVHALILDAARAGKLVGALCYGVGALAFTRDPASGNKSVIYGRTLVAHPHAWDFSFDMSYPLFGATPDNPGTDITTTGFLFPLQYMVEDAVGPRGKVIADAQATREKPCTAADHPFVTGLSVESSAAFGVAVLDALAKR